MATSELMMQRVEVCPRVGLQLTPAQSRAATRINAALACSDVIVLEAGEGCGRTTVLRHVWSMTGGAFIGMAALMNRMAESGGLEEAIFELIQEAMACESIIYLDDLHLLARVTHACDYPRQFLVDIVFAALFSRAESQACKVVLGSEDGVAPNPVIARAIVYTIEAFQKEDYVAAARDCLASSLAESLDFARIYRFAPALSMHQLTRAFRWLASQAAQETDTLIAYLAEHNMASNVDLQEVAPVTWAELKGMDDVIQELETKIALPLENYELAASLGLKPKRGVLLAGPPGTGKTTIGRALAHRLQSKFFLIDGTMIAGASDFYGRVENVFAAARKNAPSIIFIDDGDVIFERNGERGLYRYLLTKLDGLESASAERVCVIMTAMDPGCVPPAMLRSGRIELWLETRLPDEPARLEILTAKLAPLPVPIGLADVPLLARESRGLTGADLKAVVEDGKLLFAHDKFKGNALKPVEHYFLEAIRTVRANHRSYAKTRPSRPGVSTSVGFIEPALSST